jgi:hypothetical protein
MNSVTQLTETLRQLLEEEANELAKESGFIQRERVLRGADFAQMLIFGWLSEPEITLDGLTQVIGRREVEITASGVCQRFTQAAADFLQRLLERLTRVRLQAEAVPTSLLKRFTAVIVEESSRISLPDELAGVWRGGGGSPGTSQAGLKLFVRWNVLSGELHGPLLTDGRQADAKSPFQDQEVPAGGLYLGDQGFFEQGRLRQWHQRTEGHRRYYLMRLPVGTALYTRSGHRLLLPGILPQQEGAAVELGVLVGQRARVPARLILQRVPEEGAEQRRHRLRAEAHAHGREPSEQALAPFGLDHRGDQCATPPAQPGSNAAGADGARASRTALSAVEAGWTDRRMALQEALAHLVRTVCQTGGDGDPALAHQAGRLPRSTAQPGQGRSGGATRGRSTHGCPA